jgi:hypothetical protein
MTSDIHAELAQLEAEVAQQQTALASLETEVTELEHELAEFQQRYEKLLAPVAARLKAIKEAIDELEHQRYVEKRMGEPPPMTARPSTNYVSVEEQYRRAWEKKPVEDAPPPIILKRPTMEASVKDLYRLLARRFHPDFAVDDADRERRNRLMAMINEAYDSQDADMLRFLAEQPEAADSAASFAALRLRQLRQTRDDLARRIERAQKARAGLIHHDLMRLKVEAKMVQGKGRDLLAEMAEQMEQEYWEQVNVLERLRRA